MIHDRGGQGRIDARCLAANGSPSGLLLKPFGEAARRSAICKKMKSKCSSGATKQNWGPIPGMGLASLSRRSNTMNRRHLFSISAVAALGFSLLTGIAVVQQKSLKDQLV